MNSIYISPSGYIIEIGKTKIFVKVELSSQLIQRILVTCTNAYGFNVWMTLVDRNKFFTKSHPYNNYGKFWSHELIFIS